MAVTGPLFEVNLDPTQWWGEGHSIPLKHVHHPIITYSKAPKQGFHPQQKRHPKQVTHADSCNCNWDLGLPADFYVP